MPCHFGTRSLVSQRHGCSSSPLFPSSAFIFCLKKKIYPASLCSPYSADFLLWQNSWKDLGILTVSNFLFSHVSPPFKLLPPPQASLMEVMTFALLNSKVSSQIPHLLSINSVSTALYSLKHFLHLVSRTLHFLHLFCLPQPLSDLIQCLYHLYGGDTHICASQPWPQRKLHSCAQLTTCCLYWHVW